LVSHQRKAQKFIEDVWEQVLRKISGSEKEEETRAIRKFHNGEFHTLNVHIVFLG
jgi:hypothetical protein